MTKLPTYVPSAWHPECAQRHAYDAEPFPPAGSVIGYRRAVWRVTASRYLTEVEWTDADRERWDALSARERKNWRRAPYRVEIDYIGGVRPKAFEGFKDSDIKAALDVHADNRAPEWWIYPHGRWPKCSCCGEPMPCRAELADLKVDAAMERMEDLAAKLPGCCWACGEPVTRRHKTVRYVGDNIDMPGGPPVVFHIRQSCHHAATLYETRWLAADTSRRRILTYPSCRGHLIWHADGSNECRGGEPDCQGYLSHNHGTQSWMEGSHGTRRVRRPDFRDPDLPQGQPGGAGGVIWLDGRDDVPEGDGRPTCPGMLVKHRDGTAECTAGGRDDCWDGSKYQHPRSKACRDLTHGCPKCETYEGLG